ncbi:hypothetical protein THMIRHAM_08900 [Thiomicrorhabdus immobilis]|uniref:Uncharacterized protein n=1 Tax=Thiomicrorhabdus immobilis TaxID=2791037 RepID=A0ABM7MCK1_9GAMM|nr:hypothetical protein THMIRHAM_08900 [Thiomicrorhabdus immobilis]
MIINKVLKQNQEDGFFWYVYQIVPKSSNVLSVITEMKRSSSLVQQNAEKYGKLWK